MGKGKPNKLLLGSGESKEGPNRVPTVETERNQWILETPRSELMRFRSRLDIMKDPKDLIGFFRDFSSRDLKNGSDQNEGEIRSRADLEKNEILHLRYPPTSLDRTSGKPWKIYMWYLGQCI